MQKNVSVWQLPSTGRPQMFKKQNRLNLSHTENSLIFAKNQASFFTSRFFIAYIRSNQSFLKVACIAPKTAVPLASSRNFFKRKMYIFFEDYMLNKGFKESGLALKNDIVVVLKRQFSENIDELRKDLYALLDKTECFIK